jgi:hypothetical protein
MLLNQVIESTDTLPCFMHLMLKLRMSERMHIKFLGVKFNTVQSTNKLAVKMTFISQFQSKYYEESLRKWMPCRTKTYLFHFVKSNVGSLHSLSYVGGLLAKCLKAQVGWITVAQVHEIMLRVRHVCLLQNKMDGRWCHRRPGCLIITGRIST